VEKKNVTRFPDYANNGGGDAGHDGDRVSTSGDDDDRHWLAARNDLRARAI